MDTTRLKATWAEVTSHGADVPSFFYAHLFVTHPEVRDMFPLQMSAQGDRLVGALGQVVSSVDDLDPVVPFVQQLGRDHRRFSAQPAHYDAVGVSLLWTLQHFLGERWTPEVAADWAAAYDLVATTMIQAAEQSEQDTPRWWDATITDVHRVSREIGVVRIRPEQPVPYRSGQSVAVSIPHVQSMWRYYSPANAPRPDGEFEIHVGIVAGGMMSVPFVRLAKAGDKVRIGAPVGTGLVLDPTDDTDLLMVAGSTGIAPLLAVLEEIEQAHRQGRTQRRVRLVHGARFPWNLYAAAHLNRLAEQPWFDYMPAVSDDPSFPGHTGPVGDVAAQVAPQQGDYRALVCGSPAMVTHTVEALHRAPNPPGDIAHEQYSALPLTQSEPQPEPRTPSGRADDQGDQS